MTARNKMQLVYSTLLLVSWIQAAPLSKPYVPYRTSPFDQEGFVHHVLEFSPDTTRSNPQSSSKVSELRCPLHFSLGISKRWHENLDGPAIHKPPIVRSIFPVTGQQVTYLTQYEHLDLLSPAMFGNHNGNGNSNNKVQEALVQAPEFPLLWESSSFHASPVVYDVNGDGVEDAIVADYDGGISVMSLAHEPGKKSRYFHHAQVPRLHVRRQWLEGRIEREWNKTAAEEDHSNKDPYHSYFEYYYGDHKEEDVLRGVTANVLKQDEASAQALKKRRSKSVSHKDDEKTVYEEDPPHRTEEELADALAANHTDGVGVKEEENTGAKTNNEESPQEVEGDHSQNQEQQLHEQQQGGVDENVAAEEQVKPEEPIDHEEEHRKKTFEIAMERAKGQSDVTVEEHITPRHEEEVVVDPVDPAAQQAVDHVENKAQVDQNEPSLPQDGAVKQEEEPPRNDGVQGQDGAVKQEEQPLNDGAQEQAQADNIESPIIEEIPHQDNNNGNVQQEVEQVEEINIDGAEAAEEMRHRRLEGLEDGKPREFDEGMEPDDMIHDDGLLKDGRTGDDMFHDDGALPDFPADDDYSLDPNRGMEEGKDSELTPEDEIPDIPVDRDVYGDDYMYGRDRRMDDDYHRYADYDDYYGGHGDRDDFYDDKHYIRIPPHVLSTPVIAEIPRLYGEHELDVILFVAASYYFDEDEYEGKFSYKRFSVSDRGDETEVSRGMFVANAILAYNFDSSGRWSAQTHLDMSADFSSPENATIVGAVPVHADASEMGAFALASPTVADIDGDGTVDVLIGTSMGFLYAMEGRNLFKKDNWPVQMKYPIETRPLVEDVIGDTHLEVFVMDKGGNIVCFSHEAQIIWSRDILKSLGFGTKVTAASPMTLGDVNGDGFLDLVVTVEVDKKWYIFAIQAATGKDVSNFPLMLERTGKVEEDKDEPITVAQPLLVDLHARSNQEDIILQYIRRTTKAFNYNKKNDLKNVLMGQGGDALGLHIVQPVETQLFIVEAGSGCTQTVVIGDEVSAMVQVDDIHGTNKLDLLVATKSGNVLTLESPATFHPLNTWGNGDVRARNSHAHGYSASQGIFVHQDSRQFADIFGVYVPITFEIFDNRPNIKQEPEKQKYKVEIRHGTSQKRVLHRVEYDAPGTQTERVYVRYGPGYYTLCVTMTTSHGIVYEDCFTTGYNVHFMAGFGVMLWLPLVLASIAIFLCGVKKADWDDADADDDDRDSGNLGILGRALPT